MLIVPLAVVNHLIRAVDSEIARLTAMRDAVGDDWPDGFDANDIPLCERIRADLEAQCRESSNALDLGSGKHNWFLTMLIPPYVARMSLPENDYQALKHVYDQWPIDGMVFPLRRT